MLHKYLAFLYPEPFLGEQLFVRGLRVSTPKRASSHVPTCGNKPPKGVDFTEGHG